FSLLRITVAELLSLFPSIVQDSKIIHYLVDLLFLLHLDVLLNSSTNSWNKHLQQISANVGSETALSHLWIHPERSQLSLRFQVPAHVLLNRSIIALLLLRLCSSHHPDHIRQRIHN